MVTGVQGLSLAGGCLFVILGTTVLALSQPSFQLKRPSPEFDPPPELRGDRPHQGCYDEFQPLVQRLLKDLPSYANRANVRYGKSNNYVILTGLPEFESLSLAPKRNPSNQNNDPPPTDPKQVFFTTLVRRYEGNQPRQFQEYHWLFLTYTASGWRFSMMYSMLGSYPQNSPPFPPRDSSGGSLAQAIRTWFRDCRQRSLSEVTQL